jgi:hypothetical protein
MSRADLTGRAGRARLRLGGAVLLFAAVATACTATAPEPGPRFDDETTGGVVQELSCLKHQPQAPGPRYTDATSRRTDCAGDDPTEVDRQWADLYVRLGADRKNVAALLGQS